MCVVCFIFRHSHCELDIYCPFLVLLKCIERNVLKEGADKKRLGWIDQHLVSYLHEIDFGDKCFKMRREKRERRQRRTFHLTQRTRQLINPNGIDMGREKEQLLFNFLVKY